MTTLLLRAFSAITSSQPCLKIHGLGVSPQRKRLWPREADSEPQPPLRRVLSGCDGHICGERGSEAGPTAQGQAAKKPQRSPGRVSSYPRRISLAERKLEAAAQRAHTGCRGRSGRPRAAPKEARIAPPAPERPNGRPVSLAPPRFKGRGPGRGGTARTGGGPGRAAAPGTQAPPPAPRELKGRGGERRSDALGPRLTLSATLSPACARALAQVPRSLTQCRRLRRAQRPGRRNSSAPGAGRWPDRARGRARARAGDSARPEEAGSARARPRPRAGRRSRSSSGSSCRSRCSWEKRQRGRACSGRTGSLPSPSLPAPLPQTHFRSSRPCR